MIELICYDLMLPVRSKKCHYSASKFDFLYTRIGGERTI